MRREFPRKVKAAAIARANGHCERCKAVLKTGEAEVDHILEDALGGEPVLANAQVLCKPCHKEKTADRVRKIRKADRARDKASGAVRPAGRLKGQGFPKSPKPRVERKALPPRQIYEAEGMTLHAQDIVERLFEDIRDRRFLKWLFPEFEGAGPILHDQYGDPLMPFDLDVQEEIKAAWAAIIGHALSRLTADNEALRTQVERQTAAGYCDAKWLSDGPPFKCGWQHRADASESRADALAQEVERLREALTPSADTKAAYWGEFYMGVTLRAGREEDYRRVQIPWDSIKEIMAAISARAALGDRP